VLKAESNASAPNNSRLILIGDVHGCISELEILLKRIDLQPADQVVFVGDLVNRGPDSSAVLAKARQIGALSVIGNHEDRLLRYKQQRDPTVLKKFDLPTVLRMRKEDWNYLAQMPLTLNFPQYNLVVVHGGFLPATPWQEQPKEVVTRVQVIGPDGNPAKRAQYPNAPSWADVWSGPEFVVFGHTPRLDVYRQPFALGLDTGCIYGGKLSAYILPEGRIIQVPARKRYA
jgi:predicted phosphodiesterase